ncbi:MAG: hypothetical protein ACREC4_00420, partial [Methylocella sp.]
MTQPLLSLNIGASADDHTGDPLRVAAQKIMDSFNLIGVRTDLGAPLITADVSGLATSARTDTTDASNISSGTLPIGRVPAMTLYTVSSISVGSPGVVTVTGSNTLEGMSVFFQTSGSGVLPTGLIAGTQYFVRNPTADTFQVAVTIGGTPINTTGTFTAPVTAQLSWATGHLVPLLDISNTFTAVQQFGQVLFQPAAFAPPATFNNGSIDK